MNSKDSKVFDFIKKNAMIIVLILVVTFFSISTQGNILRPMNLSNLISQNAYVFILATGMLLCILTGGNIDLSVGSIVCFVGAVGAVLMVNKNMNMWLVVLIMFLAGTAIGAFQAFWIAYVRIPPFITTLAGMLAFRGLSNVKWMLDGQTISIGSQKTFVKLFGGGADCYLDPIFNVNVAGEVLNGLCLVVTAVGILLFIILQVRSRIVKKKKGFEVENAILFWVKTLFIAFVVGFYGVQLSRDCGIPTVLIWIAVVVVIYYYITSNTTVGRHFYAVGGNEKATRLSGINTNKIYFLAYTNMGLLSALAAMISIARLTSAAPSHGTNYEMDAIGSCFIGGASAYGGIGTVPGVIVGAVLMGVINQGMSLMGVDQNMQKVVKGFVLLAAVIFDVVSKRNGKIIAKN